ncbi:Hypothetical protein CINCED_3A000767 [Cinara cedri]|uniref:Uncharacterized protein n=1 Tax=Cinara cedri TaxID=506608 RepID=A0A5E4M309_9HEMI|nr:Hypothetical protein CINCED_3A000767 [Cinara cedri]
MRTSVVSLRCHRHRDCLAYRDLQAVAAHPLANQVQPVVHRGLQHVGISTNSNYHNVIRKDNCFYSDW